MPYKTSFGLFGSHLASFAIAHQRADHPQRRPHRVAVDAQLRVLQPRRNHHLRRTLTAARLSLPAATVLRRPPVPEVALYQRHVHDVVVPGQQHLEPLRLPQPRRQVLEPEHVFVPPEMPVQGIGDADLRRDEVLED